MDEKIWKKGYNELFCFIQTISIVFLCKMHEKNKMLD